ncbi:uncharacterized protein ACLA_027160 [Aspergillus clavatus NRRL 1]|uniref:Uncharacterized protein n=1 Tax=Aspergillus clavatus (strain ATCC 1007 / CBS 513.65 / DSM 816 / NCTC 3887 / NRRL 1 / QM 1276 / 107) TaxID=344612 RepID=A1CQS3_ASPCL|nr:uncharacterized protein ACLA_027160 [Aspergillus clavatus NRRL 1]EAW07994.1 hypothetical protein ACLA_027160 [Aspergillus clavatus NRRL 1]
MPTYLISKSVLSPSTTHTRWSERRIALLTPTTRLADPIFAFLIGSSAALIRIRREEREKHPARAAEIGFGAVAQTGVNRLRRWWAGDFEGL